MNLDEKRDLEPSEALSLYWRALEKIQGYIWDFPVLLPDVPFLVDS